MGNKETCIGRDKIPNLLPQHTTVKRFFTPINQQLKNQFIYQYDIEQLCKVCLLMHAQQTNPYSRGLTRKIILLKVILLNLPQLEPYQTLKSIYTHYSFLRCQLMLNNLDLAKCVECVLEDVTFKTCIRADITAEEGTLLREMFYLAGEDFNKSLCVGIKINTNRGYDNHLTIVAYLINFLENFWYDIAKNNSLHYEIQLLIDCGELDLDIKFLQFLLELTLRHYCLAITKVHNPFMCEIYIVNINLGMISSETGAILSHTLMQHFVYVFGVDYKLHMPKYLKKSSLLREYGGHCTAPRMIPLSREEAKLIIF